jgi:hypothetical protein
VSLDPLDSLEKALPAPVLPQGPSSEHPQENSARDRDETWRHLGTTERGQKKKPEAQSGNLASGLDLTGAGDGSWTHDNCVGNAVLYR